MIKWARKSCQYCDDLTCENVGPVLHLAICDNTSWDSTGAGISANPGYSALDGIIIIMTDYKWNWTMQLFETSNMKHCEYCSIKGWVSPIKT